MVVCNPNNHTCLYGAGSGVGMCIAIDLVRIIIAKSHCFLISERLNIFLIGKYKLNCLYIRPKEELQLRQTGKSAQC